MNTNMTGFRWFQESLHPCSLDERSLALEGLTGNILVNTAYYKAAELNCKERESY